MRSKFIPLLLFAVVALVIFWPIIFGGRIFGEDFVIRIHYPTFSAFSNFLSERNASSLWLSGYISGFPVYLSQQGGHLQPLVILFFKLFDFITAYNLLTFFNFFLAGVFTFLFCRAIKISKAGSMVAGLAYTFSQALMWAGSLLVFSNLFPLIPLFLICIFKIYKGEKRLFFVPLAVLALIFGWLGAFTEEILYLLAVGFVFALFLDKSSIMRLFAFFARPGEAGSGTSPSLVPLCGTPCPLGLQTRKKSITELFANFKTTKWIIVIGVISTVLASPWLLPTYNFATTLSSRAGGVNPFEGGNYLVASDFIRLVHPYFDVLYSSFVPFLTINNQSVFLYIGILPLLLSFIAFFSLKGSRNKFLWFFACLFVFALSTMFKYSPTFFLLHKLPIFNMFVGYWKWIYIMIFSWAVLAGFGFDALPTLKEKPIFKKFINAIKYATAGIIGCLIVLNLFFLLFKERLIIFANNYFASHVYASGNFLQPLGYYLNLIRRTFGEFEHNLSFSNPKFLFSMIFLVLGALLFYFYQKEKLDFEKFKKLAVVLVVLNFVILWQGFYFLMPRSFALESPKTAVYMKEQSREPFRAFRFLPGFSYHTSKWNFDMYDLKAMLEYDKETMGPNLNVLFDVDSITGIENFMDRRHSRILLKAGSEFVVMDADKRLNALNIPLEEKISIFTSKENRNILSMLNVKYILSSFDLSLPLKKVFETTATKYNIPVYVYENPDVLARVYFAKNPAYTSETNEEKLFEELLKIDNFTEKTLIECSEPVCITDVARPYSEEDIITVQELTNGYLKIKTKTQFPRWLVYSESNLPTWEARIDGQLTKIYTANYIYQAVFVPAGEHEIEFKYPGAFKQMEYAIMELLGLQ